MWLYSFWHLAIIYNSAIIKGEQRQGFWIWYNLVNSRMVSDPVLYASIQYYTCTVRITQYVFPVLLAINHIQSYT